MSEEKLYAVRNDLGEWADPCYTFGSGAWATPDKAEREKDAKRHGGHVVAFVEAPVKVLVSEDEAEMLKTLDGDLMPIGELAYFIHHAEQLSEKESIKREDRLMRAYVNGWTVEKPKRYLIKVPHTDDSYFYKVDDEYCNAGDSYHLEGMTDKKWFTAAEIEHYGLHDFEKLEVTDDEQ